MGKQVKGWKPPKDAILVEDGSKQWTPPADAILVEEEVKKKDPAIPSPLLSKEQKPFSLPGQIDPTKPLNEQLMANGLTEAQDKTRALAELSGEQPSVEPPNKMQSLQSALEMVSPGAASLFDLGRKAISVVKDQIPAAYYGEQAIQKRTDYLDELVRTDPTNYAVANELASDDTRRKYAEKQAIKILGKDAFEKNRAEYEAQAPKDKAALLSEVKAQRQEEADFTKGIPHSFDQAKKEGKIASYISGAIGNGLGQIPASIGTLGASSYFMEKTEAYDQSVEAIAKAHNITKEEVVAKNLDGPAKEVAHTVGLINGGIDLGSTIFTVAKGFGQGIKSIIKKNAQEQILKNLPETVVKESLLKKGVKEAAAPLTEYGTEFLQAFNTQVGALTAGGKNISDINLDDVSKGGDIDWTAAHEEGLQGMIGSAGVVAGGKVISKIAESNEKPTQTETTAPVQDAGLVQPDAGGNGINATEATVPEVAQEEVVPQEIKPEEVVKEEYEVKPVKGEIKGESIEYTPNKNLTADESEVEKRSFEDLDQNYEARKKEYQEKFGNIIDNDLARSLSPDFVKDPAKYSSAVQRPTSQFLLQIYKDELQRPAPEGKSNKVLFTAGGSGAGKSTHAAKNKSDAQIIFDTNMAGYQVSKNQINRALNAGKDIEINYVYRDPVESYTNGVATRAKETGRTIPVEEHARIHLDSQETIKKLIDEYKDNPRVKFTVIDNSDGGKVKDFNDLQRKQYTREELISKISTPNEQSGQQLPNLDKVAIAKPATENASVKSTDKSKAKTTESKKSADNKSSVKKTKKTPAKEPTKADEKITEAPKPKRNGFETSMRKYARMDAENPRVAILKFFALGGRVKHEEAVYRTGHGPKDLYGWTSKKGKSYDQLLQLAKEESRKDDFDEADFLNEIDDIVKSGKKAVFDELKSYLSDSEARQYDEHIAEIENATEEDHDKWFNSLTDDEKQQIYDDKEEAFNGGDEEVVGKPESGRKEKGKDGTRDHIRGKPDDKSEVTKEDFEKAKSEVDIAKSEVDKLQREYSSLSEKLSDNLKENQADMFGQNKPQSMFDDRADQQKIVTDKKKSLDNAKEKLKKAEDNYSKLSPGQTRISQAQLVDRADGRTERQINTASKRIGSASLKKLVGKLKRSFPNFKVVSDRKGFTEAYQQFKDLGILKQIIGEEGAKSLDVDDILIGKDEAAIRMANLEVAREMEKEGRSATSIYWATGWEKSKDGKWRMEIKDGEWKRPLTVLNGIMSVGDEKPKNIGTLEELLHAPELFRAYPELKKVQVELYRKNNTGQQGYYDFRTNTIGFNVRGFREKFTGRSPEEIFAETSNLRGLRRGMVHEIQHGVQLAEGFQSGGNPGMPSLRKLAQEQNTTPFEIYRKLSGEVEARNAQERAKLTEEERAARPMSNTEDVGRADQLIIDTALNDKPQLQQDGDAPNGFVFKDSVYINPDTVRADTPIHEFGHLWTEVAKNKMQPLYRQGTNLIKGSPYHKAVLKNKAYADLTPEQQLDEALAMAIGERGALIVDKQQNNRFTAWLKEMWDRVKLMLGVKSKLDFANMTLDDFLNMVGKELLTPGEISTLSNLKMPETATFRLKNFKLPQDAYKEVVARQMVDMAIAQNPDNWRMSREGLWRRTFNTMMEGFQDKTRRLKEVQNDIVNFYLDKTVKAIKEDPSLSKEEKKARLDAVQNKRTALEAALIPASEDPHGLYDLMTGRIQYRTENMHNMFFGKPTGERGYGTVLEHLTKETDVKNLKVQEDVESIAYKLRQEGLSLYDLGFYAYVKHAKERNEKINDKRANEGLLPIAGSGMTDAQADTFMKEIEQSGKKDVLEKYREIMQRELVEKPLQMKLDAGLIDQETYDKVNEYFKDYTPLVIEELAVGKGEKPIGKLTSGIFGSGIKRLGLGTDEYDYTKRVNPFVQLMFNYEKSIAEVERNKMLTGLAKLVKKHPDPNVWSIKSPKYKMELDENGEIQYVQQFKDKDIDAKGVPFMVNGKRRYIILEDPRLREMFTKPGRTPTEFEKMTSSIIKNAFSYLRLAFTGLNPSFAFPNFVRDAQDAVVNLSDSEVKGIRSEVFNPKNIASAMKSIWQYEKNGDMSSEYAQAYEEMKQNGGQIAWLNYANAEKFYTDTKEEIDKAMKGEKQGKGKTLALLPFRATLRYTLLANKVMEMAIRLTTYKAMRDAGVAEETSALAAKNVTVNFNKQGSYNPILSSLYLFLNAGIQGTSRMATSLTRSKQARKLVAASMASFVLVRILNQAIDDSEDDEDKKTLKKLTRQDYKENLIINWFQPMGMDKSVVKIPMSYNMRGFKAIADGLYDVAAGNATSAEAMADVASTYFNSMVPIAESGAVPTLAQPIVELRDNKRMFNDTPIMPESSFGFKKKDSERFYGDPSALAMGLSSALSDVNEGRDDMLEVSPNQIDYIFDWTTGGLKNWYKTGETAVNAAQDVNQFDWNKVAIIQRFYTDLEKQDWRDQVLYYDLYNKGLKRKLTQKEYDKLVEYGKAADKKELLKPGAYNRGLIEVRKIQKEVYDQKLK